MSGAFDVENYGDLLFPEIFREALRLRGLDIELVEFAPTNTKPRLTPSSRVVHALATLEEMHRIEPFDAVVIGGGALVHAEVLHQFLGDNAELQDYAIAETWIVTSVFCAEYDVPLLWNAPDVPYTFPIEISSIAKGLIEQSKYISVRNDTSLKNLGVLGLSSDKITVCPDTALALAKYLSITEDNLRTPLPEMAYFVVHINRFLSKDNIAELAGVLSVYAAENDLHAILLPLSNAHGDLGALRTLESQMLSPSSVWISESITEMAAVIRRAELYVGVSYHGAITALAHGVRAVCFNYMNYDKSADLFRSLDCQTRYAETIGELRTVMKSIDQMPLAPSKLATIIARVETHFDTLAEFIAGSADVEAPPVKSGVRSAVLANLILSNFDMSSRLRSIQIRFDFVSEKLQWLEENAEATALHLRSRMESIEAGAASSSQHFSAKIEWLEHELSSRRS